MPLPIMGIAKAAAAGAATGAAVGYGVKKLVGSGSGQTVKDSSAKAGIPKPSPAMKAKPRVRPDEWPTTGKRK